MKHISKKLVINIKRHSKEVSMLLAINELIWSDVKIDDMVYASDNFDNFVHGKADIHHFWMVAEDGFVVVDHQRSSATSNTRTKFTYALPKDIYLELAK